MRTVDNVSVRVQGI